MTSEQIFKLVCDNDISKVGRDTPKNLVDDMLGLLPDDFWSNPKARVLECNTKSRVFLDACFRRFRASLDVSDEYIWENMLYAGGVDAMHIVLKYEFPELVNIEEWDKMKLGEAGFDLVVGNPPYNKDVYLDFVMKGHQLSHKYSLWVTPAKWTVKTGKGNDEFRQKIVPYMSHICYYPVTTELFDICNLDGIACYLVGKDKVAEKQIINKSTTCAVFNNQVKREVAGILNNAGYAIVSKLDLSKTITDRFSSLNLNHFGLGSSNRGRHIEDTGIIARGGLTRYGYCTEGEIKNIQDVDKFKVVLQQMNGGAFFDGTGKTLGLNRLYIYIPGEITTWHFIPLYISESEAECKSFISYFDTRVVRFLLLCGINSQTTSNPEFYRFVPDPGAFDRVFLDRPLDDAAPDENGEWVATDGTHYCSLYVKYGLSDKEINMIESVIRERGS